MGRCRVASRLRKVCFLSSQSSYIWTTCCLDWQRASNKEKETTLHKKAKSVRLGLGDYLWCQTTAAKHRTRGRMECLFQNGCQRCLSGLTDTVQHYRLISAPGELNAGTKSGFNCTQSGEERRQQEKWRVAVGERFEREKKTLEEWSVIASWLFLWYCRLLPQLLKQEMQSMGNAQETLYCFCKPEDMHAGPTWSISF